MVSLLKARISVLVFLMMLALGLSPAARASQFGTVSFTFGVLFGSIEFPLEAHPLDPIKCNLTIGAYIDVSIFNFTLGISGFTGQEWVAFGQEQITSYSLAQDKNITRQISFILPQTTTGQVHYVIGASTDKGFGKTDFYGTRVLAVTYEELSNRYDELLANYTALQTLYGQLLANYTTMNNTFNSLVTDYNTTRTAFDLLNSTYASLEANYSSLKSNFDSLQEHFAYVEEKFNASTGELSVTRYLMYALGVTTVILAAATVYFRKKAPYVVIRKETAAKPADQQPALLSR